MAYLSHGLALVLGIVIGGAGMLLAMSQAEIPQHKPHHNVRRVYEIKREN